MAKKSNSLCWGASATRKSWMLQMNSIQVKNPMQIIFTDRKKPNGLQDLEILLLFVLLWVSDNIVGRGGYSEVYRGDLSDGKTIAVKRLTKDNRDANKEKEFLMELGVIGHVSHLNTAKLVGCCIENGLYLIFNFSQNGNLASALHGKKDIAVSYIHARLSLLNVGFRNFCSIWLLNLLKIIKKELAYYLIWKNWNGFSSRYYRQVTWLAYQIQNLRRSSKRSALSS